MTDIVFVHLFVKQITEQCISSLMSTGSGVADLWCSKIGCSIDKATPPLQQLCIIVQTAGL